MKKKLISLLALALAVTIGTSAMAMDFSNIERYEYSTYACCINYSCEHKEVFAMEGLFTHNYSINFDCHAFLELYETDMGVRAIMYEQIRAAREYEIRDSLEARMEYFLEYLGIYEDDIHFELFWSPICCDSPDFWYWLSCIHSIDFSVWQNHGVIWCTAIEQFENRGCLRCGGWARLSFRIIHGCRTFSGVCSCSHC